MKKNLLFFCMLFIACIAGAAPRTQENALAIARNFLSATHHSQVITRHENGLRLAATSNDLLSQTVVRSVPSEPAFYIYNQGEDAFVIVSGDDRMPSILGYSEDGAFVTENLPENVRNWLCRYAETYRSLNSNSTVRPFVRSTSQTTFAASVSPLLQDIQYDQSAPYNNQCPLYQGERCLTGCVATAAAQILRYWTYPAAGTGSHSYKTKELGITASFNFGTNPFDWDNILPFYSNNETETQKKAVSTLMLACGVACDMDYTPYSSGAYDNSLCQGLINYLGYDADAYVTYKSYYTPEEWMNLIKTELNEKRPIYYSGSSTGGGHAFVIDGYDQQDMVHVNWGWGGYCNGYFELLRLDAEGTGLGGYDDSSYQFYQGMIVGLQPQREDFEYVSRFFTDGVTLSNTTVNTGSSFTVTVNGIYNMMARFEGALGLVIEKDGEQTVLAQRTGSYNNNYGVSSMLLSAKFPATLEDGTYDLFMASKANSESRWNKVYGELMDDISYKMVKEGNKCILYSTGFDFDDMQGDLTLGHALYTNHEAGLTLTIKNNSDKAFFGSVGAMITNADDDIVDALECSQELINPGEEITLKINNTITADAGTYYIYPIAISGYYNPIGDGQQITVKTAASGNPTLSLANGRLESNTVENGGVLNILADLSVKGSGELNTTWVLHTYTREGEDDPVAQVWDIPFVEKGTTVNYNYPLRINAEPGVYTYRLQAQHPTNYIIRTLFEETFTVTKGSGIQNIQAQGKAPYLYATPDGNTLHICNVSDIRNVTLYNIAGQAIRQFRPETPEDTEIVIPTNGLGKGSYILELHDENARRTTIKFIR